MKKDKLVKIKTTYCDVCEKEIPYIERKRALPKSVESFDFCRNCFDLVWVEMENLIIEQGLPQKVIEIVRSKLALTNLKK